MSFTGIRVEVIGPNGLETGAFKTKVKTSSPAEKAYSRKFSHLKLLGC